MPLLDVTKRPNGRCRLAPGVGSNPDHLPARRICLRGPAQVPLGFQTLEVWESKEHYDRANTDIVFPLMRELAGDQPPTGHGEFNPLWHVFLIVPSSFDEATETAYATHLPVRSEADVDKLLDTGLATEIDTHFYFLCSVVNGHAARP
jgi:hypothetical protein